MSQPTPAPQLDLGRVAERASGAVAASMAILGAQLAVAQEQQEVYRARAEALQRELDEKDAELARVQQVLELQRQTAAEQAAATD